MHIVKKQPLSHIMGRTGLQKCRLHCTTRVARFNEPWVILSTVKWQFALVYLDDITIFSRNADDHISHDRTAMYVLHKAVVMLSLNNRKFFTENVDDLWHIIRSGKLELADHTTGAICDFKPPQNLVELNYFPGSCNVFRRSVQKFSGIAAPLNRKLKNGDLRTFDIPTQRRMSTRL